MTLLEEFRFQVLSFVVCALASAELFLLEAGAFAMTTNRRLVDLPITSRVNVLRGMLNEELILPDDCSVVEIDKMLAETTRPHSLDNISKFKSHFNISAKGGRIWEQIAKPNWSRFYEVDDCYDTGNIQICGASKDRLLILATALLGIRKKRMSRPSEFEPLEFANWQGTPWKRFEKAWRVTVEADNIEDLVFQERKNALEGEPISRLFFDVLIWSSDFKGCPTILRFQT